MEWFRTFRTVFETGTMSDAARELNVSQPGVSLHLNALETYVGYPLFERSTRKMIPNERAKLLYQEIIHSLTKLEEVEKSGIDVVVIPGNHDINNPSASSYDGPTRRPAERVTPEEFESSFQTAQKETQMAFGDNTMYIEHFVQHPRHIEFQILADSHGHVIHLGERDCSIQRNHQKMIEESPSVAISEELRRKMGEAAVKAAKAAGYVNAGTIEFLLEKNGNFYFMEMNTRIQVEHPVTEWVTGIDLIKEQIRIASGRELSYRQEDVHLTGHAIECRINAENPEKGFRPSPGTITDMYLPGGKGIRIDSAIYSGYTIPPYYDSMIAKLIVWAKNRDEAIRKMRSALGEVIIEGIDTNVDYQYGILENPDYIAGNIDIEFIEELERARKEA